MTKRGAWDRLDETVKRAPWQWRKAKGQDLWRPKDGYPYAVALLDTVDNDELSYTATRIGDEPELLDTVVVGDRSEKSARETAQTVCENHWRRQQDEARNHEERLRREEAALGAEMDADRAAKLGIATALDWRPPDATQADDDGIWTAAGPDGSTYTCEEDLDGANKRRWYAALDDEELTGATGAETLEEAKRICQWHRDTTLVWRESAPGELWVATSATLYSSEDYSCLGTATATRVKWMPHHLEEPLGKPRQDLADAQEACQEHHREVHPLGAAELSPAVKPAPIGKPEAIGKLPAPQRAEWVIPVPLTEAEKAQAKEEFDEIWDEIRLHRRDILASAERHAALKKRKTEQIGELESQLDELRERMPERPVDCVRSYVRDGEEIWVQYTCLGPDIAGIGPEILHEHQLTQFEQRQLFGEGDPPADKPPEPASQQTIDLESDTPPEEQIETAAERAVAELARQTGGEEFLAGPPPGPWPPPATPKPLKWGKVAKELTWVTKGADPQYRIDLATEPGVLLITLGAPDRPSEHQELHRWPLKVTGVKVSAEANRAKAWCQEHSDSRLRWPGDPASGVLLDSTGRYQLTRERAVPGFLPGERWRAEAIGGQDEQNTDLGEHDDLPAAQAACQGHADEQRRAGQ